MANTLRKPIKVTSESDLTRILDDAEEAPVRLERDGVVFRLSREDQDINVDTDIYYEPDPELVRRTLKATAGSWSDLDVDQVIKDVYEAREAGSRPPDRP